MGDVNGSRQHIWMRGILLVIDVGDVPFAVAVTMETAYAAGVEVKIAVVI